MLKRKTISYKRENMFAIVILCSGLLIALLNTFREYPSFSLQEPQYMLTGTTIQSMTMVTPYYAKCEIIQDDTLYVDEIIVTQKGCPGQQETTTLLTYLNGRCVSEEAIDTRITVPAIARVVHVGTKQRPNFIMPVSDYVITSYMGPRWGRNHNGIDLAVPVGTNVYSSASGTVIQSGWNGGYGICVSIDHGNGIVARYAHLSGADVTVGQVVEQGDLIGLSGNTGNSTGPHLHFEMRLNEEVVDPLSYVEEDVSK